MVEWAGVGEVPGHGPDFDPHVDLDGDEVMDTMILHGGVVQNGMEDATLTIVTDLDGDGQIDRVTEMDAEGEYTAWVLTSEPEEFSIPRWEIGDRGHL